MISAPTCVKLEEFNEYWKGTYKPYIYSVTRLSSVSGKNWGGKVEGSPKHIMTVTAVWQAEKGMAKMEDE